MTKTESSKQNANREAKENAINREVKTIDDKDEAAVKKDSKLLIDSSVWVLYFFGENKRVKEIIEQENFLLTSIFSLFEIRRKFLKEKYNEEKISKIISFIKTRSIMSELTEEICISAATNSVELVLPAIDSLIYTSARKSNALLITADNDFRGIKDVEIV